MAVSVKTKQWGNSIGIILPKNVVNDLGISTGDEVTVDIKKKQNVLKELFGALKFSKSTEELLKETRKEMESKWM